MFFAGGGGGGGAGAPFPPGARSGASPKVRLLRPALSRLSALNAFPSGIALEDEDEDEDPPPRGAPPPESRGPRPSDMRCSEPRVVHSTGVTFELTLSWLSLDILSGSTTNQLSAVGFATAAAAAPPVAAPLFTVMRMPPFLSARRDPSADFAFALGTVPGAPDGAAGAAGAFGGGGGGGGGGGAAIVLL